jgi:hypothetical protein
MKAAKNYSVEALSYSDCRIVWLGDVKAALLFPPLREGEDYVLYPHPATYPGLTFEGLPAPLRPEIMRFATLAAVYAFLGLPAEMALAA